MKVWIAVEETCDNDLSILGVFADAEKAKQALNKDVPLRWHQDDEDDWSADPRKDDPMALYQYYVWAFEVQ